MRDPLEDFGQSALRRVDATFRRVMSQVAEAQERSMKKAKLAWLKAERMAAEARVEIEREHDQKLAAHVGGSVVFRRYVAGESLLAWGCQLIRWALTFRPNRGVGVLVKGPYCMPRTWWTALTGSADRRYCTVELPGGKRIYVAPHAVEPITLLDALVLDNN